MAGDGGDGCGSIILIMFAGKRDGILDVGWKGKWIGDFVGV